MDLAREPAFRLGPLSVIPPLRQVTRDGLSKTLEPRVMQVLVALARAQGRIVGRGDLIARCWDGRIVGENAINRVVSLLRRLGKEFGQGCFEIETVTKVGYRLLLLTGDGADVADGRCAVIRAPAKRRQLVAGLALALTGVVGASVYVAASVGAKRARAQAAYAAGIELQRQGRPERLSQVVAYFREATQIDPDFAEAWGALALSYRDQGRAESLPLREAKFATARAAAHRALALDSGNRDATLALILTGPYFRRWVTVERQGRSAMSRFPQESLLSEVVAEILCETGRWREAGAIARTLVAKEPFDGWHQRLLGNALWHSGEIEWARATFDRAARQHPENPWLWLARFNFLAMSGWPEEALKLAQGKSAWPNATLPLSLDLGVLCARALATRSSADTARAVSGLIAARASGRVGSFISIQYLVVLGAIDTAFAQTYDYYFGLLDPKTGRRRAPSTADDRWTNFLFAQPTAPLRLDPRFPELTKALGLEQYWQTTNSTPDYRRAAA